MKIHENFHVIGIFHHDESNNESLYTHIFSKYVFRFEELSSARNQCIYFQVILFLFISNSEYIGR